LDFSDKEELQLTVETTVGFLGDQWIANKVRFPSNSTKKIIETTLGFPR